MSGLRRDSPDEQADIRVDVAVVGAGLSGLAAAYHIKEKDPSLAVLVLEAKDRVGGRTFTTRVKTAGGYDSFDLGGQWVGRTQPHILALLEKLGLKTYRQYIDGTKCMKLSGDNKVGHYTSTIPSLSWMGVIDIGLYMNKLERLAGQISVDNPMACKHAAEWDAISVEGFTCATCWTEGCKDSIRCACRVIFGVEPSQISFLYFLTYLKAAGGLEPVIEATRNSGQEFKVQGGTQQISCSMAVKIGTENLLLNHPVKRISQDEDTITIHTENAKVVKCSRAIIAVPPIQKGDIVFEPHLPANKCDLHQRMPAGFIIKFIITYEKAFWRDNGFSGEICSNGGKTDVSGCDEGPLSVVYDATNTNGVPALVGFIGGKQGIQWSAKSFEERKAAVLKDIAECLGPSAKDCIEYIEKNWSLEPYNVGGPVYTVTTGAMKYFVEGLRQPFHRLHFAGTESATVWCGFMNGAVQAGQRAANEVLYHIRPQLVSTSDLEDTVYCKPKDDDRQKTTSLGKRDILRWSLGLGCVALIAVVAKKAYFRLIS